ncbi:DEAD/DEAH box helicase [Agrococcus jejuensis]|uniref:Superfamily II DNA or RNA helicase n=1 Tax=Agrococcus jejuensis TaxID=399736 RepID=A0A1G8CFL2_9MICO|nr:DEAD/DEAH box helicase [Agrococcus jejuensis]SDH44247.1 Superfamily II DNA or RNA helicase [Agrococcus jejuensis]
MWPDPDPNLVAHVERLYANAMNAYRANPVLVEQDSNHEENIRVGGYSERTLMELVQNAADALKGANSRGRVEIVLTDDALYCANEGREFSARGVEAVSHAFLSVKQGDEIGRFGLGFKSVLAVTDAPQVLSKSVAFEFNTERSTNEMQSIIGSQRSTPKLRTPVPIDANSVFAADPVASELATWATTIIKMPGVKIPGQLIKELREFGSEFLLFVGAVKEIRLRSTRTDEPIDVSHVSRDLGGDRIRIESPDGTGEDWYVLHKLHRPSSRAKEDVGQAVSRSEIQISVAAPVNRSQAVRGRFWSYFPLQDETTASALFNAPWSVNDDRTTLLPKEYNREILRSLADLFVDLLPRLSGDHDPALHFDYMPARGREALGFGDELLSDAIPRAAAKRPSIPTADGRLELGSAFAPLAFDALALPVDLGSIIEVRNFALGPASKDPHHTAYQTPQRRTRLQDLFIYELDEAFAMKRADRDKLLTSVPVTQFPSWLTAWASVSDHEAANALRAADEFRSKGAPSAADARVIPLADGRRATLKDSGSVHLPSGAHGVTSEFVAQDFLKHDGVLRILQSAGFRELTPAVRLEQLVANAGEDGDSWSQIWDLALDLRPGEAVHAINSAQSRVLVPTLDGGWAPAETTWDVPDLANVRPDRTLDRTRCVPQIAARLGVADRVQDEYPVASESQWDAYVSHVLQMVNLGLGPGERSVTSLEINDGFGPGPFSVLADLAPDSDASILWTRNLLAARGSETWDAEDAASNRVFEVEAPHLWAVRVWGRLDTKVGAVPVDAAVSPLLTNFDDALPVGRVDLQRSKSLGLPETLAEVDTRRWRDFLDRKMLPTVSDDNLAELTCHAVRALGPDAPRQLHARVGLAIEKVTASTIIVARDAEQTEFLRRRQKPYIAVADDDAASTLVEVAGLKPFEQSFNFSWIFEGESEAQPALDLFSGLREHMFAPSLSDVEIARADAITKRVASQGGGFEDQPLSSALQGRRLYVLSSATPLEAMAALRDEFSLPLEDSQLDGLRQAQVRQQAEMLRAEARAAGSDAERLEILFGEDDLREKLGDLWDAVVSMGGDREPSLGQLLLDAHGQRTLSEIRDLFEQEGFSDFPQRMAGNAAAVTWVESFGFSPSLAGSRPIPSAPPVVVVPGRPDLPPLHDYQQEALRGIQSVILGAGVNEPAQKAMVQLPTGAGKTRTAAESVLRMFDDGRLVGPVLWIAQTKELCEQAVQTWSEVWRWIASSEPLTIGRLWGDRTVEAPDTKLSVIVATDAKLAQAFDGDEYEWLKQATAVFVDEAHVAGASAEYRRLFSELGIDGRSFERPLLGLSATPFKGYSPTANESLAVRFGGRKIDPLGVDAHASLVHRGVLARVTHEVLGGVDIVLDNRERQRAEDLGRIDGDVLQRLGQDKQRMKILVEHVLSLDETWPILIFTPSVLSAQTTAAILKNQGVSAAALSGQTPDSERREQIERFKAGDLRVLVNCDLLTQGFDAPSIRALYVARPTLSPNRYIQMVGRGLRGPRNGGKEECLIVDLKDNFGDLNRDLAFHDFDYLWEG